MTGVWHLMIMGGLALFLVEHCGCVFRNKDASPQVYRSTSFDLKLMDPCFSLRSPMGGESCESETHHFSRALDL